MVRTPARVTDVDHTVVDRPQPRRQSSGPRQPRYAGEATAETPEGEPPVDSAENDNGAPSAAQLRAQREKNARDRRIIRYLAIAMIGVMVLSLLVFGTMSREKPPQLRVSSTTETTQTDHQTAAIDAPSITAPVGHWSEQRHIPGGRCLLTGPLPAADTYRLQYYWDGVWHDYTTSRPVSGTHFRVQSVGASPIRVSVRFPIAGSC